MQFHSLSEQLKRTLQCLFEQIEKFLLLKAQLMVPSEDMWHMSCGQKRALQSQGISYGTLVSKNLDLSIAYSSMGLHAVRGVKLELRNY